MGEDTEIDGDVDGNLVKEIEDREEKRRKAYLDAEEATQPKVFSKIYTPPRKN